MCLCGCVRMCVYAYMHARVYVCMCLCVRVGAHACVCTYIHLRPINTHLHARHIVFAFALEVDHLPVECVVVRISGHIAQGHPYDGKHVRVYKCSGRCSCRYGHYRIDNGSENLTSSVSCSGGAAIFLKVVE